MTCGRYFRNQSGLTKHRRTQHLHSKKPKAASQPNAPILPNPAATSTDANFNESQEDIVLPDDFSAVGSHVDNDNECDINMASPDEVPGDASLGNSTNYHPLINGKNPLIQMLSYVNGV